MPRATLNKGREVKSRQPSLWSSVQKVLQQSTKWERQKDVGGLAGGRRGVGVVLPASEEPAFEERLPCLLYHPELRRNLAHKGHKSYATGQGRAGGLGHTEGPRKC